MNKVRSKYRILFAGGGTGGHLYPAIAVAEEVKKLKPNAEILFVGSKNKVEGRVIPKIGFEFKNIIVRGFARKISIKTFLFPFYLLISMIQSLVIAMKFKPLVAIGTGGYVAGPAIWASSVMGAKVILIEPNSYPGITTRLLEKYADEIHISFDYTKQFLRRNEILKLTGNPVRSSLKISDKIYALKKFNLSESKKTLLIIGGSLGADSINKAIEKNLEQFSKNEIQLIWQVGKNYFDEYSKHQKDDCKVFDFIENMDEAFSACDLVIARAGASTISEIALLGLAAILIPSPNVAENHQYHNAKALADNRAVIMIEDKNLETELFEVVIKTLSDEDLINELKLNVRKFSKPDAAFQIARDAINYIEFN